MSATAACAADACRSDPRIGCSTRDRRSGMLEMLGVERHGPILTSKDRPWLALRLASMIG
jgi:hypothetical protein